VLQEMLETEGARVTLVENGRQALEADWAGLAERYRGNAALVDRIATLMVQDHRGLPEQLRRWAADGNLTEIAAAAHSLIGVAGNLMSGATVSLAQSTQLAARTGHAGAAMLALQLADSLDLLLGSLVAHLHGGEDGSAA
jgi:hypothetical protein